MTIWRMRIAFGYKKLQTNTQNMQHIMLFHCKNGYTSESKYYVIRTVSFCAAALGRVAQSVLRLPTGWTVRGSNPGGDETFRNCPDRPWGPPSLLYDGYRIFPGGKERPGLDADPSTPFYCRGHDRVELYLYSPYGQYGLYRASVPVQGCNLPYLSACTRVHFTLP